MFSNNSFGSGGNRNNNRNNRKGQRGRGGGGGPRTNCFKPVTAFNHGKIGRSNHKHSSFGASSSSFSNGTLSMVVGQMNGNWFMCTAGGSEVKIWNLQTLQARKPPQLFKQRDLKDKFGIKMDIGSVLFVPPQFVIVGLAGTLAQHNWGANVGYVQMLDLMTLSDSKPLPAVIHPISKPMAHTLNISAMCVLKHKSGSMIMSASKDASIRIWKPHPELGLQVAGEMTGHARKITSMVQFGQKVYTSSEDHSVNVWDATNGNLINSTRVQKGENHKQSVNCVVPYTCRAQSNATFVVTASYVVVVF